MGKGNGQSAAGRDKKNLIIVFCFTSAFLASEVVGGNLRFSSLASLADTGYRLCFGLALELLHLH